MVMRRLGVIAGSIFCCTAINPTSATPAIELKKHSGGYLKPIGISVIKEDPSRLFVVEQGGLIKIVSNDGITKIATPFLDASTLLGGVSSGEKGLLGLAFHPDYANNGKFFIDYTQTSEGGLKELSTIVSQFLVDASNPDVANTNSETILLKFTQPYQNHNGGDIQFGPDGYLYIATGDGGGGGDPDGNGQNLSTMLGKILRIDVDNASNGQNYAIPVDNPFVTDSSALDEIWAYGLRNPWRISFDMKKGNLFIADVGQKKWEEVNFQRSSSTGGQNYGWNKMEGFHCYELGCDPSDDSLTLPILEYEHINGACSITGGYVHRGDSNYMYGKYFYGDYCTGSIWATEWVDNKWEVKLMYDSTGLYISSFGQDTVGNVYVISIYSGTIYQLAKCKDNKKFKFGKPGKKRLCGWIKLRSSRIDKHCKKEKVKRNCRRTCDNCGP